jgi:hypothetical protein
MNDKRIVANVKNLYLILYGKVALDLHATFLTGNKQSRTAADKRIPL